VASLGFRITKNTFFLFFGQIAVLALNTVTLVLLARYWDASVFGIFSYALVWVGFFTLLPDFGIKSILVRELSRKKFNVSIVGNALFLKLVLSTIAMLGLWLSGLLLFQGTLRIAIFILSWMLLLSSKNGAVRVVFESVFYARMEMQFPMLFQFLDAFFQMAVVLGLILIKASFSLILLGYTFAHIPGLLYTLFCVQQTTPLSFSFQWKELQWLLKESFPLFLYLILVMFYERIDVLYLKALWGDTALGIYSSAFRLTAPLVFIPTAVCSALYPAVSEQKEEHGQFMSRLFSVGLKILFVLGMGIGVLGVLVGKPIFLLLFGKRYLEAVFPFQCLLLAQGMMFILFFLVDWNNARDRQSRNTIYMFIMLFIALGVQWVWIRYYGLKGAGIAKLILNGIGLGVLYWVSLIDLDEEKKRTFFYVLRRLFLLVGVTFCLIFFKVPSGLDWVILGILFPVICYRLFLKEERRLFKKIFQFYMPV